MSGLYHVDKAYGEKQVLRDFTLTLPKAGSIALMAPSGSGKTTALRLLAGLDTPDRGEVIDFGDRRVAYQFQEDRLLPWYTVRKNLALFARGPVEPWLSRVGLAGEAEALPGALSGGMRRRLALARALSYEAEVLLLDEPLKEMDSDLRERMVALIRTYGTGPEKLLVLVTHSRPEAEALCDRVITLTGMPLTITGTEERGD